MNSQIFFLTHAHAYIESPENSRLLGPDWAYVRQQYPSFLARDSNACFSHIFEEKTFHKLTLDEINIFSSLRTFQSFCETCQMLHFRGYSTLPNIKKSGGSFSEN